MLFTFGVGTLPVLLSFGVLTTSHLRVADASIVASSPV